MRHNIETMIDAGSTVERVVAVGGGTQGGLWTQIVADVAGRPQSINRVTTSASFSAAFLAGLYRAAYPATAEIAHSLARLHGASSDGSSTTAGLERKSPAG